MMRKTFCESMLEMVEDDKTLFSGLVFSNKASFHLSDKVSNHNVRIRETYHPHEAVKHQKDSPKANAFCAVCQDKVYAVP